MGGGDTAGIDLLDSKQVDRSHQHHLGTHLDLTGFTEGQMSLQT